MVAQASDQAAVTPPTTEEPEFVRALAGFKKKWAELGLTDNSSENLDAVGDVLAAMPNGTSDKASDRARALSVSVDTGELNESRAISAARFIDDEIRKVISVIETIGGFDACVR